MNIYIGNLHPNASDRQVTDLFEKYGKVKSVRVIKDMHGTSQGFGFVSMDESADSQNAIKKLNKFRFMDHSLEVDEVIPKKGKLN